jgi:hypothetical protein
MAGDPNKAAVWANADVLIAAIDSPIPAGGAAFSAAWDYVGLLSGEDGFGENMSQESTDFYAWGGILVATTRRNFKYTRSFTALEDNQTVLDLVYPGNTITIDDETGFGEGDVYQPDMQAKFMIAFQTESDGVIKRVVSSNYAQIDERGESTEGEDNLQSRPLTVAIYPDDTGKIFHFFKGYDEVS